MSSNWIIYEHISPSGKIYVGITSKSVVQRWGTRGSGYLHKQPNGNYVHKYFASAILKYDWENFQHNIIASNLGEKTAKNMEKDLIRYYKSKNISYNITDGGDGRLGTTFHHSEKSKELISINHRRKQTQETKNKISNKQLGNKFPQWRKNLLSKAHDSEKIKVNQYSISGDFINSFNSIMEAERCTNIKSGNISNACNGKSKTAGGFIWKKVNNYEVEN